MYIHIVRRTKHHRTKKCIYSYNAYMYIHIVRRTKHIIGQKKCIYSYNAYMYIHIVRRIKLAGHCLRNRKEIINDVLLWNRSLGRAKAGKPARTYILQL